MVDALLTLSGYEISKTGFNQMSDLPEEFTQQELAGVVGLSAARICQLTRDGVIPRKPGGKYSPEAITAYIRHVKRIQDEKAAKSKYPNLLLKERYRALKRSNDEAHELVAPVEDLDVALSAGCAAINRELAKLPGMILERVPDLPEGAIGLANEAAEQCQNILFNLELAPAGSD